jgi:hypothetical protein
MYVAATTSFVGSSTVSPVYTEITEANAAVSLTSSTEFAMDGQPVTFMAVVTNLSNSTVPTGQVEFLSGSTNLATVTIDASGMATFTTSTLAVGDYSVTAVFIPTGADDGEPDFGPVYSNGKTLVIGPDV